MADSHVPLEKAQSALARLGVSHAARGVIRRPVDGTCDVRVGAAVGDLDVGVCTVGPFVCPVGDDVGAAKVSDGAAVVGDTVGVAVEGASVAPKKVGDFVGYAVGYRVG